MGMVFNNFLHFPDLWVYFSVRIHLLVSFFGISGFMGMIFRNFSGFMGILLRNFSGFIGLVLLLFEWHSPVSWKLKLPPPRAHSKG